MSSDTQTGQITARTSIEYNLGTTKNEIVKKEPNFQNHYKDGNTEIYLPPDIKEHSYFKEEIKDQDQEDNIRNYTIFPTLSWLSTYNNNSAY